jgi:hypothetical protein
VVEVGEGRHRQHVARHLLRPLLDLLGPTLAVVAAAGEACVEGFGGDRRQRLGQRPVVGAHPLGGGAVDGERLAVEPGDGVAALLDRHVALADLLGVVERVGVQEGPQEVAAHPVEGEDEVGVLEGGVVAGAVEVAGQPVAPLAAPHHLVGGLADAGHLVGADDPLRRVAGAGGGDPGVVTLPEVPDQADDRLGRAEGRAGGDWPARGKRLGRRGHPGGLRRRDRRRRAQRARRAGHDPTEGTTSRGGGGAEREIW